MKGKMEIKKELLKMLRDEMMGEHEEEMREGRDEMYKSMGHEPKMKAVIAADSKEGLIEGAKKLPEALTEAEKYMKERFGKDKKDK